MGVDNQTPPLPAPTEAFVADDSSFRADDFATDISRRTDRTHYSMPDDGSPATITTKPTDKLAHGRHQHQTSLLVEYFEAGKAGDQLHSRPSVRVRVTPSSKHRRSKTGNDRVDITQTEKDQKHSYTRKILLPPSKGGESKMGDVCEVSYSSESSLSGRPPVEVEVLQNASDLSFPEVSQGRYVPAASDITSVPPDGMLDGISVILSPNTRRRSRSIEREEQVEDNDKFKGLSRRRSRSMSRERIVTQRIMKKLAKEQSESSGKPEHSRQRSISREQLTEGKHSSWRKPSRSRRGETLTSGTESSLLTFDISRRSSDTRSIPSGVSTTSSINTPKLFATVEDATKRLILPEINALKESQTQDKYERFTKESLYSTSSSEPKRRVSKASNAPNMKIVLNRDKKDPGVVLSSDSVRSKKPRRPNRDSGSERSCDRYGSGDTVREDDKLHKKSKDKQLKDATIAGAVGAGLTAAALARHDTETSMDRKEGTKKWSKIRGRTGSISKCIGEEYQKNSVAPLPMQSVLRSSELTRDSIFSADTERPSSSRNTTAIREISRGTPCSVMSPTPSTPTRTPTASRRRPNRNPTLRGCSASGSTKSNRELSAEEKASKPLAAAGISGAAFAPQHSLARTPTRVLNESELNYEDRKKNLTPHAHQPTRSADSISSSGRDASSKLSELSLNSAANSPSTNASRSRRRPHGVNLGRRSEVFRDEALRDWEVFYNDGTATSRREEDAEKFFEYEHEANDALRAELEEKRSIGYTDESLRSPNPLDYDRLTTYTDDSADGRYRDRVAADQEVREVGGRPDYVATPAAVESAVASPIDPSTVSVRSSQSDSRMASSQPELQYMQEQHQSSGENTITGQPDNNGERWVALRDQAKRMEECGCEASPPQSEGITHQSDEQIQMTAIAMPFGDPMLGVWHGPENESDVTTNLLEIQAPARTPGRWSYGPSPPMPTNGVGAGEAAVVEGAAAHLRDGHGSTMTQDRQCQPSVEDDSKDYGQPYQHEDVMYSREHTTPISAGHGKDERYISAAQPGYTPEPQMESSRLFEDTGLPDMSGGLVEDGPCVSGGEPRHVRNFSGNSHGMSSPLYDSATGKGLGRIRSKDIVALMDYLTAQDAQRNARDTEILVTLFRSAAEMRNSFKEMKKFIAKQDRIIMSNTDKDAELSIQRTLQGPRPQLPRATRSRGRSFEEVDGFAAKRKNVFGKALYSLSMKNSNELARIEHMLIHLLDEVEGLKDSQAFASLSMTQDSRGQNVTSYENLRATGDPGYELEGRANTASTQNQSETFSKPSSRHLRRQSGHDRHYRSGHGISTIRQGDEDLNGDEVNNLSRQFKKSVRLLTPTEEVRRSHSTPQETPPQQHGGLTGSPGQENTYKNKSKQKSNSSSLFGIPKVPRWSKITASTEGSTRNGKKALLECVPLRLQHQSQRMR